MKKLQMTLLMMCGIALAALPLIAETETVGGYTWTYQINGDTVEIVNYHDYSYSAAISPWPREAVTIPSTLGGKPVTSIGYRAFYNCSGLTSVTIPDSVTNIGSSAFSGCNDALFDTTTIPGVKLVDGWAVGNTGSLSGSLDLIGVRGIGGAAFSNCSGLTSVTIPDSVTSIGSYVFSGCSGLMSISVGSGNANYKSVNGLLLSKDGKTLIQGVNGNVTVPSSVTSIWSSAFSGCTNLNSVTIPDSVTSIGSSAFYNCRGLTSVTIPDSVTSIGDEAFEDCSGLTGVTIPNSVTNIGYAVFRNCSSLTSVMIPNGVMNIGACAFEHCSGLTNVNLSSCWRLTDIGHGAFGSCTNLSNIAIPYSVEKIGTYAFDHCTALFDTNTISGVKLIDGWAVGYTDEEFKTVTDANYGYSYKELDLSGVRGIADGAFEGCPQLRYDGGSHLLVSVKLGNYISRIGASAFAGCDYADFNLSGVQIGSIGELAFSGCYSVSVSDNFANVDVIGDGAFRGCRGLADSSGFIVVKGVLHGYLGQSNHINIPDGVTRIGPYAFDSLNSVDDIMIPDSVTNIAHDAFYCLNSASIGNTSISIGKGVSIIEEDAFYYCSIMSMTVDDENPCYKVEDGILKTKEGSQIIYAFGASFGMSVGMHGAWTTGGGAEWGACSDYAQSGTIDDGQESWLEVPVSGTGVISFRWKASSEAYRDEIFDFATFSVDGVEVALIGGETDWTNVTHLVVGNGPHVVRWTYKKDEDGSDGGDCVWLDDVQYTRKVHVSFSGGDEAEGNPPDPMIADLGEGIVLPDAASLVRAKYTFAGWRLGDAVWSAGAEFSPGDEDVVLSAVWNAKRVATPVVSVAERFGGESTTVIMTCETSGASIYYTLDGTEPTTGGIPYEGPFNLTETATIRAIAVKDDWFDSDTASAHSVRIPVSLSGCLNSSDLKFRTGGAAQWTICLDESHDGEASARSGNVGDGQESWIETVVTNSGVVSFWWKVSSEASKKKIYDGIYFSVDGEQIPAIPVFGGEQDWTNVVYAIESPGQHVLRWTYEKDGQDKMGEDCAWLDEVTWTANDPLPALDAQATDGDAAAIVGGLSDVRLSEKVIGTAAYTAFRNWVDGKELSHTAVRDAPNAWLSYALDAPALMAKATPLASEDIVIESIVPSGVTAGTFDLVVDIAGAEIGTAARLAEVLGVEGATELDESEFSSDGFSFYLQRTAAGKVKVTVTPEGSPTSFFLRVKMK